MEHSKLLTSRNILIAVILLAIAGLALRSIIASNEILFGFDPFYHMRIAGQIAQTGIIPTIDTLGSLEPRPFLEPPGWYALNAYFIILLGIDSQLYGLIMPPLLGGILVLVMYLLGKTIKDEKLGLLFAFVTAFMPALAYRSMAGFAEEDMYGLYLGITSLTLLMSAFKTNRKTIALLGGIILGYLLYAWATVIYFTVLAALIISSYAISKKIKKQKIDYKIVTAYVVPFVLLSLLQLLFIPKLGILLVSNVSLIVALTLTYILNMKLKNFVKPGLVLGIIIIFLLFNYGSVIFDSFNRYVQITQTASASGVGEESPGHLFLLQKFNLALIPIILGVIVIIYHSLKLKPTYIASLIIFLSSSFLVWNKLKFSFLGSFGLILATAIGLSFLDANKKINNQLTKLLAIFLILGEIASGTIYISQQSNLKLVSGLKEAGEYLSQSTDENIRVAAWWDKGHALTYYSGKGVLLDNFTGGSPKNTDIARLYLNNVPAEDKEYIQKLSTDFNVTHIVIDWRDLVLLENLIHVRWLKENDTQPRNFIARAIQCNLQKSTLTQGATVECAGLFYEQSQFVNLPKTWTDQPGTFLADGKPLYLYIKECDSKTTYCDPESEYILFVLDQNSNDSFLARAFFENNINGATLQFSTNQVKVYKVD